MIKTHTGAVSARLRFTLFVATTLLFLGSLTMESHGAEATGNAAPRSQIVEVLSQRFSEEPAALGLADNGGLVEVFKSTDGSSWTMLLIMPNGMSRVIAEGQAWTDVQPTTDQPE